MESAKIETGKEYSFAGYRWIPIEVHENKQIAVMQSLGVTAGPWPGYSMPQFGNGDFYDKDIVGEDISSYNEVTEKLMEQIRTVAVDTVSGCGLYLASYENIDSVEDVHINSVWKTALTKATANYRSFGASSNCAWTGTCGGHNSAWFVYSNGSTDNYNQNNSYVVPAAFNLDLSKVEIEGDEIVVKTVTDKNATLSVKAFDRDWNQETIRNLVKNHCYLEFGQHADLKALCINEEDILPNGRDWMELTFIVPLEWLKNFCRKEFGVKDLDYFLQEEYTTDESEIVFSAALNKRQVVMVDFM